MLRRLLLPFSTLIVGLNVLMACVGEDIQADPTPDASDASSDSGPTPGTESGECFPNNTCLDKLTCVSNRCVDLSGNGGADATNEDSSPKDATTVDTSEPIDSGSGSSSSGNPGDAGDAG